MKLQLALLLLIFLLVSLKVNGQQILMSEDFESAVLNPLITIETVGAYNSNPAIKNSTVFGSTKAFGFGLSNCPANCFNDHVTDFVIKFPSQTFVDSFKYCEMELFNNWGSQGDIYIDGNLLLNSYIGNLPTNDFTPDLTPRCKSFIVNQSIDSIVLHDWDITNLSEIYIDDLIVYGPASGLNFYASDNTLCEKFCTNFYDSSQNNTISWQWFFPGANPSSSTNQNPTNICYNEPGTYDVTCITTSANGNDTLILPNYISVYPTPPPPIITQVGYELTSSPASSYQWQFNTVNIPGATNQSYTVLQTGYYTIEVGDVNSCKNAASIYVLISGEETLNLSSGISIYPNPTLGNLTVDIMSAGSDGEISINVMNTLGRKVFSSLNKISAARFKKEIDLTFLKSGVYYILLQSKSFSMQKKILLVH